MFRTLGLARKNIIIAVVTIAAFLFIITFSREHALDNHRLLDSSSGPTTSTGGLDRSALCRKHNFSPFRSEGDSNRKVYDLFLLSHELDWLEIRLNTLAPYVDYFVIVESPTTFTGLQKPLYLQENWNNFTKFHNQIIHKVVEDPGDSVGPRVWDHEDYMRNSLFHSSFPSLGSSEKAAREGDAILVSDVDEIPKPEALNVLRYCDFPDRLTLRSHFYYYSFQWLHVGEQWPHPQATVFHGLTKTITPNDLRMGFGGVPTWIPFGAAFQRWWQQATMWDAAWHCSSCFATLAEMRAKMEGFSHTPWNTAENRDEKTMIERVRNGLDLFGRPDEQYARIRQNQDVPRYILDHNKQFGYMLDRDGESAGFSDWRPTGT